jgi:hypothetical protein
LLNSLLKGYSDSHYNGIKKEVYNISSGSLNLDTYIKVKTGQTIKIGGATGEVGKTSQSLLFAKNYMETVPNSKTIYINAEAKFGEEIRGRSGMIFTESPEEWVSGSVFVLNTNIFDTICDILTSLLKQLNEAGQHLCIIIDSIDMLILKSSLEKEISAGKKPAGVNYLTKELFRRIGHSINSYGALLIMIAQYSATFQLDPYAKAAPQMMEGNQTNALNHQVSYALYYRQRFNGDYILEKEKEKPDPITNKILGVNAKVEIKKSATDNSGITVTVPIRKGIVGSQVWKEKECVDAAIMWDLLKRAGPWFSFSEDIVKQAKESGIELKEKIQGINGVYEYFEQNKDACNWFYDKFKSILAGS